MAHLRIITPEEPHQGSILVADASSNDVAEFFHNEHATVTTSYDDALRLAQTLVFIANLSGRDAPLRAGDFDHKCAVEDCCSYGQKTYASCACHVTREQMMLAEIARLRKEGWLEGRNAALACFDQPMEIRPTGWKETYPALAEPSANVVRERIERLDRTA